MQDYRAQPKKPPVPQRCTRTTVKCEASPCLSKDPQPRRRRSLSTEEEIRSIGCFGLKQSPVNKSKQLNGSKPTWLQICDPCHRILERSLTPDLSDLVLWQRISAGGEKEPDKSVDLELSQLRFIDSSSNAGDLHSWPQLDVWNGKRANGHHGGSRQAGTTDVPVNVVLDCVATDKKAAAINKSWPVNNKNPEREYLCRGGNSLHKNGVDELIINNKVLRRFGDVEKEQQPPPPPPPPHPPQEDEADGVANKYLGGQEERTGASESSSSSCRMVVRSDRQRRCLTISSSQVGEDKKATQLPQHRHPSNDGHKNDSGVSARDSFEEDYERCIESINRQLKLESRDVAGHGRTRNSTKTTTSKDDRDKVTLSRRRDPQIGEKKKEEEEQEEVTIKSMHILKG